MRKNDRDRDHVCDWQTLNSKMQECSESVTSSIQDMFLKGKMNYVVNIH